MLVAHRISESFNLYLLIDGVKSVAMHGEAGCFYRTVDFHSSHFCHGSMIQGYAVILVAAVGRSESFLYIFALRWSIFDQFNLSNFENVSRCCSGACSPRSFLLSMNSAETIVYLY